MCWFVFDTYCHKYFICLKWASLHVYNTCPNFLLFMKVMVVKVLSMHICEKDEMFLSSSNYMETSLECKEDALVHFCN